MVGKKYLGMNFLWVMFSLGLFKLSWKCAMEYSLEISGMLELGHKVVETKIKGLDQVIEGFVL